MRKIFLAVAAIFLVVIGVAGAIGSPPGQVAAADGWIMYVGTYTRAPSKGIYAYRWQPATGAVTALGAAGLAAETENPSFLAVHPNQRFLYAVNETAAGGVSAFAIEAATGSLRLLNRVASRGAAPCHLALDGAGKWLFAANYTGGSIAAFPVHADGTLGEASAFFEHQGSSVNKVRQNGPHAHATVLSPDNRFVLAVDLGLDRIFSYRLDASRGGLAGQPAFAAAAPGSGPRHLAFRPDGKFAYVVNELQSSVTSYRYDAGRGRLAELQTLSALPDGFSGGSSGAEIAVHPAGRFVYASNRGHDSIAAFGIDAEKGTLTPIDRVPTQGRTPRGFAIDPDGRFLVAANQDSGSLVVFRVDQATGRLAPTGTVVQVPSPVSVVFSKR